MSMWKCNFCSLLNYNHILQCDACFNYRKDAFMKLTPISKKIRLHRNISIKIPNERKYNSHLNFDAKHKNICGHHVYIEDENWWIGKKSIDIPSLNYQLSNVTNINYDNEYQLIEQNSHRQTVMDVENSYWCTRIKYSKYQKVMAFISRKLHYIWDISNIRKTKNLYTPKDVIKPIDAETYGDQYDFEFIAHNLLLIFPVYIHEMEQSERKPKTIYIYDFSKKETIYSFIHKNKFAIEYNTHYNETDNNNQIILYFHSIHDKIFTVHKYSLHFIKNEVTVYKHENIANISTNMNKKVFYLTIALSPNGLYMSLVVNYQGLGMRKVLIMDTITNQIIYSTMLTSSYQHLCFKQLWMTTQILLFVGARDMDCSQWYALCDIRNDVLRRDLLLKYVGNIDLVHSILDMIRFEKCNILLNENINDLEYVSHLNYICDNKEYGLFVGCSKNATQQNRKLYHFTVS